MILVYKQIWKTIEEFPMYEVSNYGMVRSWQTGNGIGRRKSPHLFSIHKNIHGYPSVGLSKKGRQKPRSVHRLVLEAFEGPCPPGMQACHKNGKRDEPDIWNLRWDTCSNNHIDKKAHGTWQVGEACGSAKLTNEIVRTIKGLSAHGVKAAVLARDFKTSESNIYSILSGNSWAHITDGLLTTLKD